ncbi:hypothetical protein MMC32_004698 [Xylographa parallela]|nr:hypothetical protein [Xylographa parallela]
MPALFKIQSVSDVLVAEQDRTVFSTAHPKHLPLLINPVEVEGEVHEQENATHRQRELRHTVPESTQHYRPLEKCGSGSHASDEPVLHHNRESSVIQLFFDLFFVANLTAFTSAHEINNRHALGTYIQFFFLLWGIWFQVAIFDVRFSNDSVFERLCKALQFGVMTGLAIVGPDFGTPITPDGQGADVAVQALQSMALIFMAMRLILACQYLVVIFWLRRYRKARTVLLIHAGTSFLTAMLFLGVSYAVNSKNVSVVSFAWYAIILFEVLICFGIASRVEFMNFKKTSIVERLGLLTLIILGEGVVGICDSISRVGVDRSFSSDVIGMIICAIMIIYLMWMLYYDQTETEHVGSFLQHIWMICHFPLHLAVLLTVEGISQFSVWRKVVDLMLPFVSSMENYPSNIPRADLTVYFNNTIQALYGRFSGSTVEQPDLGAYFDVFGDPTTSLDQRIAAGYNITYAGIIFVCENFEIELPESNSADEAGPEQKFEEIYDSYIVVFIYFFVAAGLTLIFLALLFVLGRRERVRGDHLLMVVRVLVGLGLSFLALMALPSNPTGDIGSYVNSAWMLPTVAICYALLVLFENLLLHYVRKVVVGREKKLGDYVSVIPGRSRVESDTLCDHTV